MCISSKYTLKTLKRNALLKEFCDLLVLLVMVPMPGDEGLFGLSSPPPELVRFCSAATLSAVSNCFLICKGGEKRVLDTEQQLTGLLYVDGVPVPLPVCLKVGQSIFGRQFFK